MGRSPYRSIRRDIRTCWRPVSQSNLATRATDPQQFHRSPALIAGEDHAERRKHFVEGLVLLVVPLRLCIVTCERGFEPETEQQVIEERIQWREMLARPCVPDENVRGRATVLLESHDIPR